MPFSKKYYLDETLTDAAFNGLRPETKGWIKKTLSCQQAFYAQKPLYKNQALLTTWESYTSTLTFRPRSWCLVLYEQNYQAVTRAVAAVAPAVFAGVQDVYALAVRPLDKQENLKGSTNNSGFLSNAAQADFQSSNLDLNLTAGFELTGVEDLLAVREQELLPVIKRFFEARKHEDGCILILGDPGWSSEVFNLTRGQHVNIWKEGPAPRILFKDPTPAQASAAGVAGIAESTGAGGKSVFGAYLLKTLKALHPDAKIKFLPAASSPNANIAFADYFALVGSKDFISQPFLATPHDEDSPDNIFSGQTNPPALGLDLQGGQADFLAKLSSQEQDLGPGPCAFEKNHSTAGWPQLSLDASCAGCWVWPALSLDFFVSSRVSLFDY